MPLFRRSDGDPITGLSPLRRIMPALMRKRNESGSVKKQLTTGADGTPRCFDSVSLRWTFDERIHDGFYCAASLELLRDFVENPAEHVAVGRNKLPRPQPAGMLQAE